jgi:hypothetical protein
VRFSPACEVRSREEAASAAATIGYPVVLKSLGTSHKSDAGGVVLRIADENSLLGHVDRLTHQLHPPSFSVEAMVTENGSVEILVGGLRDRSFGPTITVAAGGTLTELLNDRRVALAPVDRLMAEAMLRELKIAPLLFGFRGALRVDLGALADLVEAVSQFIADHPSVIEVEVNPVMAHANGALGVDARIMASA